MTINVLQLSGNYKIRVNAANGFVYIDGNSVIGADLENNTIELKSKFITDLLPKTSSTYNFGAADQSWNYIYTEQGRILSGQNVGNKYGRDYDPGNIYDIPEHRNTASLYVSGGVGIEKDLNVGGFIYGRIETANTSLSILTTSTNLDYEFYPTFVLTTSDQQILFVDSQGITEGLRYNPFYGRLTTEREFIAATDDSTGTDSGALVVAGGVGVARTITIGDKVLPDSDLTGQIGEPETQWAEAYVHDIYTRLITSTTGTVEINPAAGLTDVFGDIRVRGTNPIGTAPVVTNVLYVTVDGNDTNDGRAQDASRACRTIGAALNSPYYQPGTQILVSAGHYLEDNPLRMKPYTSIRGSDIRTTFIEPINKTQDLFHVESGCYLNYMTFINGRSGLLEGDYASGYNRGAYATAFPPQSGDNRIDLFHSPYIQNCTNQSGPWLKDSTMFVPNQTVQVPAAVGTGTWSVNTTTIVVKTVGGAEIIQGMSINAGQQNAGFFNARTLMLANKPFLQEQVVRYINNQISVNSSNSSSIWYGFVYNQEKCRRDVGILVENIAYDATFGGNEKAVESGLAYWNGVVSLIAGQEIQTTAAINYLSDRLEQVIVNTTCTNVIAGGAYSQVRNTALTGGSVAVDSISNLVDIITTIINDGPSAAPDVYKSTGPDAAFVSAEILMQANRKFIQEDTINYINNIIYDGALPYSEIKCRRDSGLIVDSIAIDMLYDSETQSRFAGLQYWNQSGWTGLIESELSTTTNAIRYLRDLSVKIIQNITPTVDLVNRFESTPEVQDISTEPATQAEVNIINPLFDTIIDIVQGNNKFWTNTIIPNGNPSNIISVQNAVTLLQANRNYMAEEVNAYVRASLASGGLAFTNYDQAKCKRDVTYIIDCISFDLLNGGNRQSIQAAVYYLGFDDSQTTIQNQVVATTSAFDYLSSIAQSIVQDIPVSARQTKVKQNRLLDPATSTEATILDGKIGIINSIINNINNRGTPVPISYSTRSTSTSVINAYNLLKANRQFIVEEVIAYIDETYNYGRFNYDEALCYRDTGLIVDAVSQDILLGGNAKSVEAGLAYWNFGYNQVTGQETTTTMAINHARDIALQIIANQTVTAQTGTSAVQVINTFFQYGGDYMPQQAVTRSFGIVTDIIEKGPLYAPPVYQGGGLFALTGLNGSDVVIAPTVASSTLIDTSTYVVGLSRPTVGFGTNATLYFGDVLIYPMKDSDVEAKSLEYTGNANTWNQRKVDPIGSMGGSLVDGGVISERSPIQSFVYDAFTQLTQGGHGVKITNDGYAQLVSVFTIFSSVGVQVDNGGIASIVNSNANFGDICLLASGYGTRKFSGTVYNPPNKAYPDDPELNQYYPSGYWPNNANVRIFLPDLDDRPHISLVMEIVPPEGHYNEQGFPGFLNASPNTGTLTTSSITISGIDTDGIAIGNSLYVRDQNGSTTSTDGVSYVASGTIVTGIGYKSVTLNYALTSGGSDSGNTTNSYNNNYFDLYFCGNSYYTVLSSTVGDNPKPTGVNIIATGTVNNTNQVAAHIQSLVHLNSLTNQIINNQTVTRSQRTEYDFIYDSAKCSRDVGLLVDALAQDLLFDGTSQSDFSGIQYWNHGTRVGDINRETTATTNAINYVKSLAKKIVVNDTSGERYSAASQTTGTSASTTTAATVGGKFELIVDILNNGISGVTDRIVPNSLTALSDANVQNGYDLLQANRTYLQTEAIAYVEHVINYDQTKCSRDTGLIIDAIALDMLYPTAENSQSTFAGIQYWNHGSYTGAIGSELTTTTNAINYVKALAKKIIFNDITGPRYQTLVSQNTGTSSIATSVERNKLEDEFTIITNILSTGTTGVTDIIVPNDINPSTVPSIVNAYDILIANTEYIQAEVIAYVEATKTPGFVYSQSLCSRDVGYMIESVSFDLLHGGNKQAIQSGVYYYGYNSESSAIDGEISNTIGAYNYISSIIEDIILGNAIASPQQMVVPQDTTGTPGTSTEVTLARSKISTITNIILNGPSVAAAKKPISLTVDGNADVLNAASMLERNSTFIQAETIAYINANLAPFIYNTATCYRDVGYIVDSVSFDLLYGGNRQSIQSGVYYWGYNASSTALPSEQTQSVAAYDYMKSLLSDIVTGSQIQYPIQNNVSQVLSASIGTTAEVTVLENLVDRINDIIITGPSVVTDKTPIDLARSTDANVINAAILLEANRNFLKAEITAYVDWFYPSSATRQVKLPLVTGGSAASTFIDLRFNEIRSIIGAADVAAAEAYRPASQRTKTGPAVQGGGSAITLIKANIEFLADEISAYVKTQNPNLRFDDLKCQRDTKLILQRLIYDIESGGRYNSVFTGLSYWSRDKTHHIVQLGENVTRTDLFPDGANVNFYQRSYISASGYVFEYVGAGTNYGALPQRGVADPVQGKEVVQLDSGKVFFTSTDQNGDFRIGPGLVISQATGVLSGRTFTKSLFANMTPFILAIEAGGGLG